MRFEATLYSKRGKHTIKKSIRAKSVGTLVTEMAKYISHREGLDTNHALWIPDAVDVHLARYGKNAIKIEVMT